jgi:hypothetical protein
VHQIKIENGNAIIVDEDGNLVSPEDAKKMALEILDTASRIGNQYEYVYLAKKGVEYKIGKTNNIDRRMTELGADIVYSIPCHVYEGHSSYEIEKLLQSFFEKRHLHGEWYALKSFDVDFITAIKSPAGIQMMVDTQNKWSDVEKFLMREKLEDTSRHNMRAFLLLQFSMFGLAESHYAIWALCDWEDSHPSEMYFFAMELIRVHFRIRGRYMTSNGAVKSQYSTFQRNVFADLISYREFTRAPKSPFGRGYRRP